VIGFLNLQGAQGTSLLEADRARIAPLFKDSRISNDSIPKCDVLFIYCSLGADGSVAASRIGVRDMIREAGAYVAVVASENDPDSYIKGVPTRKDWRTNIVMVIERRSDRFALFFRQLFERMLNGQSMLLAWVELAPQIPGRGDSDVPATIMAAEAGHIVFAA